MCTYHREKEFFLILFPYGKYMSTLINYSFKRLGFKIKAASPYNYQFLQAEYEIKSVATIHANHLTA